MNNEEHANILYDMVELSIKHKEFSKEATIKKIISYLEVLLIN